MTPSGRDADPYDSVWAIKTSAGPHLRQVAPCTPCPQQLRPLSPPEVCPAGPASQTPLTARSVGSQLLRAGRACRRRTPPALRRAPLIRLPLPTSSPPEIMAAPSTPRDDTPRGRPWEDVLAEALTTARHPSRWSSPWDPSACHGPGAVAEALGAGAPPTTLSGRGAAPDAPGMATLHGAVAAPRQVVPEPISSLGAKRSSLPSSPSTGSTTPKGRTAGSTPSTPIAVLDGFGSFPTGSGSPSSPKPNKKQAEWIRGLSQSRSWVEFESAVKDFTGAIAPPPRAGRNNGRRGRPVRRKQPGNHEEAKRIQQLYSKNRKVAIREIRQEESPLCNLPPEDVANFFEHVFSERLTALDAAPEGVVLPKTQGHDESVFAEFSKDVIAARLRHCSNTAPGPDGITYSILRSKDPGCHVLYEIFERCRKERRVPTAWKAARTILLYKKGERKDLSNWRPISLSSCIYKVYSGILAARLARWAATSGAISSVQKGFMPAEGCLEHNFIVQECIDMAKTGTELVLTWLDLRNAFGSVPHVAIFELLQRHGVSSLFIEALREMYDGCSTTITTETGETRSVPMKSGVKQGDPLSPIVFNLAIEVLLLTALKLKDTHGFSLFGRSIISLAYADDIVLIAKNPEAMQEILQEDSTTSNMNHHLRSKHFPIWNAMTNHTPSNIDNADAEEAEIEALERESALSPGVSATSPPPTPTPTPSPSSSSAPFSPPASPAPSASGGASRRSVTPTPTPTKGGAQQTLSAYSCDTKTTERLHYAVSYYIVTSNRPLNTVEKDGFKAMLHAFKPSYKLLSRRTLTDTYVPRCVEQVRSHIKSLLNDAEVFSMTSDNWTSDAGVPFTSLTAHFFDKEWVSLYAVTLSCRATHVRHTGANLKDFFTDEMNSWNLDPKNCVALTTDNASEMRVASEMLGVPHMRCIGHTIQNGVEELLGLPSIKPVIKVAKDLLAWSNTPKVRSAYVAWAQKTHNAVPKVLPSISPTRWWTELTLLKQICESHDYFREFAASYQRGKHQNVIPGEKTMFVIRALVTALRPLEAIVTDLSADTYVTASAVLPVLHLLEAGFEGDDDVADADAEDLAFDLDFDTDDFKPAVLRQHIVKKLRKRFCPEPLDEDELAALSPQMQSQVRIDHKSAEECHGLLVKCSFLDPRYKGELLDQEGEKAKKLLTEEYRLALAANGDGDGDGSLRDDNQVQASTTSRKRSALQSLFAKK
ncbi:LINE-1 retrotransposable element ORF2 protein, partial [Frankliniella fusca]